MIHGSKFRKFFLPANNVVRIRAKCTVFYIEGVVSPSLQPRLNIVIASVDSVIASVAKQSHARFLAGFYATLSKDRSANASLSPTRLVNTSRSRLTMGGSVAAPAKTCKASAAAMLAWLWSSRRGFCNARLASHVDLVYV